jgi:hypothetical protein
MLLLAIGIAFGFSERALSSFESIVMPPKDGGTPAGGPTDNKGATPRNDVATQR